MVAELAKCQANNGAAGFNTGYLSGFPESDFTAPRGAHAQQRQRALLLHPQDPGRPARRVALHRQHPGPRRAAGARRLGRLAHRPAELQPDAVRAGHRVRRHERGADRPLPADRRRALAHRRAAVRPRRRVQPARRPTRTSSTACTPTPRCPSGSARPASTRPPAPPATATSPATRGTSPSTRTPTRSAATARPSTSGPPNAIAGYLTNDTCEHCNTYNMLKLTRELWLLDPNRAGLLRLLRAGAAQPPDRRAEPGRQPRPHHLLHPAQPGRPPRRRARRGAAAPGAPTTTASGAARAPASRPTPS